MHSDCWIVATLLILVLYTSTRMFSLDCPMLILVVYTSTQMFSLDCLHIALIWLYCRQIAGLMLLLVLYIGEAFVLPGLPPDCRLNAS